MRSTSGNQGIANVWSKSACQLKIHAPPPQQPGEQAATSDRGTQTRDKSDTACLTSISTIVARPLSGSYQNNERSAGGGHVNVTNVPVELHRQWATDLMT
mmetsp:Transcript_103502/g.198687  ORF Transcript_103502/g.198687 Transcript_103502/m.198687 type:complete len:100 (-) Transcript_103502:2-301(-)